MREFLQLIWTRFCVAAVLLVLIAVVVLTGVIPVWQSIGSADWQAVPCTILESGSAVMKSRWRTIPDYRFAVEYRYEFAGQEYRSSKFSFFAERSSATITHSLALNYPPGGTTTCFVNPRKPEEAVLDRSIRFGQLMLPASFVFGGALLLMIWWLNRRAKRIIG